MRGKSLLLIAVMLLGSASAAFAQGAQTGLLRGTVTTADKASVPGATVTIKSPALQAARTTTTETDGTYLFRGLPPGIYTVTIAKTGLSAADQKIEVPLGGTADLNVVMGISAVSDTVSVTAGTPSILATPTVGLNIKREEVNALATPRGIAAIANISPAVTQNTPNNRQLVINGSMAYDNVFLINGVDVNDNLFGSAQNLFIEDAIQETQVLTSGISAEYGRFTGGIINAITKSGGNFFSGSYRMNLSNPTWSTLTPFEEDNDLTRTSKLSKTHEATFGGPVMRDKVWFFFAGRLSKVNTQNTFDETGIDHLDVLDNKRSEIKLTMSPSSQHSFSFNYINNITNATQPTFGFSIDPQTIYSGHEPNSLLAVNWRGQVGQRFFSEVGFSQRKFSFENEGGTSTAIVDSPMISLSEQNHYNAPYFDATDPESRDNRQLTASLGFSEVAKGRHDIKIGYEFFRSHRTGGNSQSATNFVFDADYLLDAAGKPVVDGNGRLIPVFEPFNTLLENWLPVRGAVSNNDNHSLYIQDHWAANRQMSFDLGLRYEKVHSEATGGILGVDTHSIVPRLAMAYDLMGNGKHVMHATYSHYSGKYNETLIGGNNNVGNPDVTLGVYVGPAGQGLAFAPGFNPDNYIIVFGRFPTANVTIAPGMHSPLTKEFTISDGVAFRNGSLQFTYVWRKTTGFIEDSIDIANGETNVVKDGIDFGTFTNIVFTNSDTPQRDYQGLVFQGRYQLRSNWSVAGNWTVQLKNDGNFEGEAANQPGIPSVFDDYPGVDGLPSIYDPARHAPVGHLASFQRHKVRFWTIYSMDLGKVGKFGVSGMVRGESGRIYSLVGAGEPLTEIQTDLLIAEGYPDAPSSQNIFFGERGSQHFKGYTLLDSSITYDIPVFKELRPWLKFDVYNVLNNRKQISWNTTVHPDYDGPVDARGLPLNYVEGGSFGNATSQGNFPQAFQGITGGRTFLISFGLRF